MPEVSETQNLDPQDENLETNDGIPSADAAGQVAQGEPADYADRRRDDEDVRDYREGEGTRKAGH